MYGSEWSKKENRSGRLYLFDVTELSGLDHRSKTYQERHEFLRQIRLADKMPTHWHIVANYPTLQIDAIWHNLVESEQFEGVVFRNPEDTWNVDILRSKLDITVDLRVIDFEEGEGKNAGSLGALIAVDASGNRHNVGGGLKDKERIMIWRDKERFRGKVFEGVAKKRFDSGKMRHLQFKGWHSDKE
jgi:ATP-dependent DNA ligase